jgi:hypothetical protein
VFLPRFLGISKKALSHPYGRIGLEGSQGGVGAHLIHEYQPLRIDLPDLHAPQHPQELVSF